MTLATIGAIALIAVPGAGAATIRVDTTADEHAQDNGRCALREAIYASNNDAVAPSSGCELGSGNDLILLPAGRFELSIPGTGDNINLTGDLDITEFVTISHTGTKPAIIDGNDIDRVLHVSSAGLTRIVGVTITGGELGQNGGGIFNTGALALDRVTIYDNQGLFGGGVANAGGTLSVNNSTFSGNTATSSGGGLSAGTIGNATQVVSSTFTGNTANLDAGGIQGSVGSTSLRSVLIAGNTDTSGGNAPDCQQQAGSFESSGNTLIGDPTGCAGLTNGPGDIEGADPRLGPLAFNGGPTRTHLLGQGSPAINKGGGCPGGDQRGAVRKVCDIGAYERLLLRGILVNRVGTPLADVLGGTGKRDAILGLKGPDRLLGGKGRDALAGGDGKDRLLGGNGPDTLSGGAGNDRLLGGKGPDLLIGGPGRDVCIGGPGKDVYRACEVKR